MAIKRTDMDEQVGAELADPTRAIYVNLRTGRLAETTAQLKDLDPDRIAEYKAEGFVDAKTKNNAGTEYHFLARPYDHLTGYITNIRWMDKPMKDGGKLVGWIVFVQVKDKTFAIEVRDTDHPFFYLQSALLNIDFDRPVKFRAFGKTNDKGKFRKVLLLYQGWVDEETGEPKAVPGLYRELWVDRELAAKINDNSPLTETDRKHLAFEADGKTVNRNYPYIKMKADGKWSTDVWAEFLHEKMESEVIPAMREAQIARAAPQYSGPPQEIVVPQEEESVPPSYEDDIPF